MALSRVSSLDGLELESLSAVWANRVKTSASAKLFAAFLREQWGEEGGDEPACGWEVYRQRLAARVGTWRSLGVQVKEKSNDPNRRPLASVGYSI